MTGSAMLVVPLPGLAVSIPRALRAPFPTPFLALLDPFLPSLDTGVRGDLARLFGDVVPFPTEFLGVSEFPGGPTYLAPHPTQPFRRLTQELARWFPESVHHPAAFTDSPHVSLDRFPGESLEDVQREVEPSLPAGVLAGEAALWQRVDQGGVVTVDVVATFPFGTSAA